MTKRALSLLAAAAALLAVPAAASAEPAHTGTLDASKTEMKWSGGPLVGLAPTQEVDAAYPCGMPGHGCEDALLNLPAGGDLTVKMSGTNEGAVDLDLYLFESDAAGEPKKMLRESINFGSEETVSAPRLKPGFYLVRVNSSVSGGGTYDAAATVKNAGGATVVPVAAPAAAPAANAPPTVAIAKLARSVRAKGLKGFKGSAGDDRGVARVELALQQVKGGKCSSLTASGAFKRAPSCDATAFLAAKGTSSWSFRLRKALKKGAYRLVVRATDADGATTTVTRSFRVK